MRTQEELQSLFQLARDNGCPWIEVDGVKLPVPVQKAAQKEPIETEINLDPCAGMSDEEILFWSTPRYDEIQAEKESKKNGTDEKAETPTERV